jgi:hypothetical protein
MGGGRSDSWGLGGSARYALILENGRDSSLFALLWW